jgi:hypothetical protein
MTLRIAAIPRICRIGACRGTWLSAANLAENVGEGGLIQGSPDHHGVMANEKPGVQQHTDNRQKTEQPTLHRYNPIVRITTEDRPGKANISRTYGPSNLAMNINALLHQTLSAKGRAPLPLVQLGMVKNPPHSCSPGFYRDLAGGKDSR